MKMPATITRIQQISAELNGRFRQRTDVIECMLASMLAGELVLLLGPRGEAKTAIVEALAEYITGGAHFSVGLAKSSTPDDILGGVDVVALQAGTYTRNVNGFLPTATTFLLDEGFKSNNPTLQALLRVLSEREFQGVKIPALFGAIASNELPPELRGQKNGKSTDLGPFEDSLLAFFDRFFHKLEVQPLEAGSADWDSVIFGAVSETRNPKLFVTPSEIKDLQESVKKVVIPASVQDSIRQLAISLADQKTNVHVSTRTWRKAIKVLQAHAMLAGRTEVKRSDLRWLEYALWTTPDQKLVIRSAISGIGSPELKEALATENKVAELFSAYKRQHLQNNQNGIVITDSPVSNLSHVAAQEPLILLLKNMGTELLQLNTPTEDSAEVTRVLEFVDKCRKLVMQDMLTRLKALG
jgi:MoxR-like ATPase